MRQPYCDVTASVGHNNNDERHGVYHRPSNARSIVANFAAVSSCSTQGSEPATIPAPAKRRICPSRSSAQRSTRDQRPRPRESDHPTNDPAWRKALLQAMVCVNRRLLQRGRGVVTAWGRGAAFHVMRVAAFPAQSPSPDVRLGQTCTRIAVLRSETVVYAPRIIGNTTRAGSCVVETLSE